MGFARIELADRPSVQPEPVLSQQEYAAMSTRPPMSRRYLPGAPKMIARLRNRKPQEPQAGVMPPAATPTTRTEDRQNRFAPRNRTDRSAASRLVLVVEGDPDDRRTIIEILKTQGLCADSADKPDDIKHRIANDSCDLVILDLSIGESEGLALLYDIRCRFDLPVIVTAPSHIGENARASALELGADDCITKPFGLREFLARIHAILRRREHRLAGSGGSTQQAVVKPCYYRFGGWQLDRPRRQLTAADGTQVPLTKSEYGLLATFIDNPMVTLSREQLLQATRVHEDLCNRSIDVQILRLRRKLQFGPKMKCVIRTVRGAGYMFMLPVESIG
jgi:two-component system, OmpR family, response regulator